MAWRYHGRAKVDPSAPSAFGVCDRCGFWYNLKDLQWQYQYSGTQLLNLRLLVCETCLDEPQPQLQAIILPPDPLPVFNARPEPFSVDETGPTQEIEAQIVTELTAFPPTFYVDLYSGDPADGGESVLSTLTGSSTRTNYLSVMGDTEDRISQNESAISFTTQSPASVFVGYVVIFDAPTGGSITMKAPLLNPQTVVLYNGCTFQVGGLDVRFAPFVDGEMITEVEGYVMVTEGGDAMIVETA